MDRDRIPTWWLCLLRAVIDLVLATYIGVGLALFLRSL